MKSRLSKGGIILGILALLVAGFEGKRNEAYPDPVAIPTICYGHTADVKYGDVRTDEECLDFLKDDTLYALKAVDRLVKVELTQSQRIAFASFVYNVGIGNFARSTALRKLNRGDIEGACNELPRWIYSRGKKLQGLINRRDKEKQLCLS